MATTIGKLNAMLSMDSTEFVKGINIAKQQAVGFAKDATQIFSMSGKAMSGVVDIAGASIKAAQKSLGDFTRGIANVVSLIPGGGILFDSIAHPFEAAQRAMERSDLLAKQASRLGIDPQFLKGLSIAAENEAGAIDKVMTRLLRFQGQLRIGSDDLMTAGGSSASKLAARWGLDFEAIRNAKPEELLGIVQKRMAELAKDGTDVAFAMDVAGKGAAGFLNTLRDSSGVAEWVQKVRDLGVATKETLEYAKAWDEFQKSVKLRKEAAEDANVPSYGLMSTGIGQMWSGDMEEGFTNFVYGLANKMYTEQRMPPSFKKAAADANEKAQQQLAESKPSEMSAEDTQALVDQLQHWEQLTRQVGMAADEVAIYKLRLDHAKSTLRDQVEEQIKAHREAQRMADALEKQSKWEDELFSKAQAMRLADEEKARHPLDKLLDLNGNEMLSGFTSLESQFGTNRPPQFAGAMLAGSTSAYSAIVAQTGTQDMATRVAELRVAIEANRAEVKNNTQQLRDALEEIAVLLTPAE